MRKSLKTSEKTVYAEETKSNGRDYRLEKTIVLLHEGVISRKKIVGMV